MTIERKEAENKGMLQNVLKFLKIPLKAKNQKIPNRIKTRKLAPIKIKCFKNVQLCQNVLILQFLF